MRSAIVAGLVLLLISSTAHAETIAGRASVIDGDTIEIHGERIRILDIDAPESRQPSSIIALAKSRVVTSVPSRNSSLNSASCMQVPGKAGVISSRNPARMSSLDPADTLPFFSVLFPTAQREQIQMASNDRAVEAFVGCADGSDVSSWRRLRLGR